MSEVERLYGVPGSEVLYRTAAEVWESELEASYDDDEQPDDGWVIEEWTVRQPRAHLPRADVLVEHILERWVGDETTEDCYEHWQDKADEAEVEAFLEAWANRVTYRMADDMVAEHRLTLVDGEPHFDGEPLYRKAEQHDGS